MKPRICFSNDVECFAYSSHSYETNLASRIENEGLPIILELYKRYSIRSTFFFTARFANLSPKSLEMVKRSNHEIGCHGYDHCDFYDQMSYVDQVKMLIKSKSILEDISGTEVCSFRAPALRINSDTVKALEETGFRYDSSVASQRFDGPFTSGAKQKLGWLFAPRNPYHLSHDSPFRKGNSSVVEVPVSAMLWPFIGTHMRISPVITRFVQRLLILESKRKGNVIVFLIHPAELMDFLREKTKKRGNFFSDQIRHHLKMRNLGDDACGLLDRSIRIGKKAGAQFVRIDELEHT